MPDQPRDTPTHGVHVVAGEVPEGIVPPSASPTPPAPEGRPQDAPEEWVRLARTAWDESHTLDMQVRCIIAAVLPEHERQVRKDERRRLWEKAEASIPDTLEGDEEAHENAVYEAFIEQRVREQVAAEIEAQKTGCPQHPMPLPKPSCWTCGRDGAFHRAARITRGEGR